MNDIESFLSAETFGVAGASNNRAKYGNKVLRSYLQNNRVAIPIHPAQEIIEGLKAYRSVLDAPPIESLSVITPPAVTERIVEEAIEAGVKHIWMQPGAESEAAIEKAKQAGLTVIAGGPCVLVLLGFREEE